MGTPLQKAAGARRRRTNYMKAARAWHDMGDSETCAGLVKCARIVNHRVVMFLRVARDRARA